MTQLDYGPAARGAIARLLVDRLADDRTDRCAGGGAHGAADHGAGDGPGGSALFDIVATGREGQGDARNGKKAKGFPHVIAPVQGVSAGRTAGNGRGSGRLF